MRSFPRRNRAPALLALLAVLGAVALTAGALAPVLAASPAPAVSSGPGALPSPAGSAPAGVAASPDGSGVSASPSRSGGTYLVVPKSSGPDLAVVAALVGGLALVGAIYWRFVRRPPAR